MTNALTVGWRRSIWGILGQQLALLVHVAIVATGIGVLVATTPGLLNTIRFVGAGYLAVLGVRLLPQYSTLIATVIIIDVAVMWGFFAATAQRFTQAATTRRGLRARDRTFGALFLLVAAGLTLTHV